MELNNPEIKSRFQILRELGRGGTAQVFEALEIETGQKIALKIFYPHLVGKAFVRELEASFTLDHPNIVRILGGITDTRSPALVCELVSGISLLEFQKNIPYVLPELSVRILIDVLSALEHAHEQGIIHRDLKPQNILISNDGEVKVADFGLAKLTEASSSTLSGTLLGSPDYMSPEQARGDIVDPRSDLFALGSILYFMVTGISPFAKGSPLATLAAVNQAQFEKPSSKNPKISFRLTQIIEKSLKRNPQDRYSSAQEMKLELENYLINVGLNPKEFTSTRWSKEPARGTFQALHQMATQLKINCETSLKQKDTASTYLSLSHLALVAPSSEWIKELSDQIVETESKIDKKKRIAFVLSAAAASFALLVGSLILLTHKRAPDTASTVVEKPSWVISSPEKPILISQSQAEPEKKTEPVVPIPVPAEKPVTTQQKPVQKTAQKIRFDIPNDVEALWDGVPVNPAKGLQALPGTYRLTLKKQGFRPIQQKVKVSADEPTIIRVGAHPGDES